MDAILLRLAQPDPSNRILLATADFLHCIFGVKSVLSNNGELIHPYRLSGLSIGKDSFQAVVTRLVEQFPSRNSKSLKNARNDTAFLICLLSTHIRMARGYLLDHGKMIASLVNHGILGKKEMNLNFQLDPSSEDAELLQYFIYMLKCIVETGNGESLINEYDIVSILLMLLLGPCEFSKADANKRTELDNAAWSALLAIAKYYPASFIKQHGATSLLAFLKSFGGTGREEPHILGMCMHIIRILLSVNPTNRCTRKASVEIKGYFIEREGMAAFLSVLRQLMFQDKLERAEKVTASNALFCCSILATSDPRQKKVFYSQDGVSALMLVMKRLLYNRLDRSHIDVVLQTALTECICSCVTYVPACLEEFLANEGVLQLLDLMEFSENPKTTAQIVSCLLQLCDYPRCLYQLLCWSRTIKACTERVAFGNVLGPTSGDNSQEGSTSDNTLAALLCILWKGEESRLKVLRDPDGCIASLTNPLMSRLSIAQEGKVQSGTVKSLLDLSSPDYIRHKLFVLVKAIVELTKTEAILFEGLSLINQINMATILNYDSLKTSEICAEIIDEMHQEGFSNSSSRELSKLLTISKNRVATVIELQRYLVRRFKEKEATTEHEFYSLIKQCKLQDHLIAAKEIDFLARTTNYQFLVEKRLWQKCELENAAKDLNAAFIKTSRIHRTSGGILNITAWTSRTRCVESEPTTDKDNFSLDDYADNVDQRLREDREDLMSEQSRTTRTTNGSSKGPSVQVKESHDTVATVASSSLSTTAENLNVTPDLAEGGFYQISPYLLQEALEKLEASGTGQEWLKEFADQDEENGWRMMRKWKQDWYPLEGS